MTKRWSHLTSMFSLRYYKMTSKKFTSEDLMLLAEYHISPDCGFLLVSPKDTFMSPYYQPWLQAAAQIAELLEIGKTRSCLDQLPELTCSELRGHRELRLAHTTLTTLASAYIWCSGERGVPDQLPRNIAVPLWDVSEKLGVKPIICHMSACLANCKIKNSAMALSLDNMEMITCRFIHEFDIDWFFLTTAQIELDFTQCLLGILGGLRAFSAGDSYALSDHLATIAAGIGKMTTTLGRMHDRLTPEIFYGKVRPFLAGYEGLTQGGLNFEGVETGNPIKLFGASAAQSSTLPTIDGFLGVKHEPSVMKFLVEMRSYMPPSHTRFIELIEMQSMGLRDFILDNNNKDLITAYNFCLQSLVDFRSYHIQIITKYILSARRRVSEDEGNQFTSLSTKGTGGTGILPFLRSARTQTMVAMI